MSVVGINFGSATSGAGFDVTSTVAAIMEIQRAPETTWNSRITTLQSQDTALTTLGKDLSSLSTALNTLTAFDGALSSKAGASSDPSVVELTSANTSARAGTHSITVSKLAQTSSEYSDVFASTDTLSGTLTLQVGSGNAATLSIDSTNNTLPTLVAAINSGNFGVTASIVTDKTGSRLSLISNTSGSAGQITASGTLHNDTAGADISFNTGQTGADAEFTVDGLSMTSSSNTVDGAIPGTTFQLLSTSTANVQVEIANDTSTVSTAINTFVTAYNQLITDITAQEGKDSSGNAQPLFGSTVLSTIQARLSSIMGTQSTGSGSIGWLMQLGISVGTDGKLSLDSNTLSTALNSNFNDVQSFFQSVGNFGQNFSSTLLGLGTSTSTGTIAMALSENSGEEGRLNQNTSDLEARLTSYQQMLTNQLNTANQILQGIPQQLDQVKQIYAAITGYGNSD